MDFLFRLLPYGVCVVLGFLLCVLVLRKKPIFESGLDRDGTLLMFLLFGAFFFMIGMFQSLITGELLSNIIGNITGGILTAVAFTYKDKSKGG